MCAKEPGYYKSYPQTSSIAPYVHFHCTSCPYQWMLCRLCHYNMQPQLPSKRDQLRNIKSIYSNLIYAMKQHTEDNHHNIDKKKIGSIVRKNMFNTSTENNTPFEDSLSTSPMITQNNILLSNLDQIFPDVPNNRKRNKHNFHTDV